MRRGPWPSAIRRRRRRWCSRRRPRAAPASCGALPGPARPAPLAPCGQVGHQQPVATHLAVVVHAVLRVLRREGGPVAPLPQQQQPVVAQPVFLVGAGIAREKILDLLRRGGVQPALQLPIGGPGLQRVAADLGQQLRRAWRGCPGDTPAASPAIRSSPLGWACAWQASATADQCQNSSQHHWSIMDKSQQKRALRERLVAAAAEHARSRAPLRHAAAGHAHLAGQPARHRDRRVLADQGRVRSLARAAPLEGRRGVAGGAAAAAHRPAGGGQGATRP